MWTAKFWKQTAERAIKTAAQTFGGMLIVEQANILTLDWKQVGSVVLTATVLSVISSIVPIGPKDTPSLVK